MAKHFIHLQGTLVRDSSLALLHPEEDDRSIEFLCLCEYLVHQQTQTNRSLGLAQTFKTKNMKCFKIDF